MPTWTYTRKTTKKLHSANDTKRNKWNSDFISTFLFYELCSHLILLQCLLIMISHFYTERIEHPAESQFNVIHTKYLYVWKKASTKSPKCLISILKVFSLLFLLFCVYSPIQGRVSYPHEVGHKCMNQIAT